MTIAITKTKELKQMKTYLTNLITEKGTDLEDCIELDGHISLTYQMLIDFICGMPEYHPQIRKTLVMIDFKDGDVFHYLNHLTQGMVKSLGY